MSALCDDIVFAIRIYESLQIKEFDHSEEEESHSHEIIHDDHPFSAAYDELMHYRIDRDYYHRYNEWKVTVFFHTLS